MRPTAAVYAHFDPGGRIGPHVLRALPRIAAAVDRLVIVSTAELEPPERAVLAGFGELVVRENVGYDFYSWKTGLDLLGDLSGYARVVLGNDSVVGPLGDFGAVLAAAPDADVWSMTASAEIEPHLQSWFTVYERGALLSGLVGGFWRAMTPVSHRYVVIRRYEVGQSRLLRTGGLRLRPWFTPTPVEAVRAELRHRSWLERRAAGPGRSLAARRHRGIGRELGRAAAAAAARPWDGPQLWNPCYGCWDAALVGRLPYVKLETIRDDPVGLDSDEILTTLEHRFPEEFAGIRDHLDRTRADLRRLRRVS